MSVSYQFNSSWIISSLILFLALRVVRKGSPTVTTLTTLKLPMLTTFWPPCILCALRFQNYKGQTINHRGRGKKASALLPRKKKQVPCCRGEKKWKIRARHPPTMINGSSLTLTNALVTICPLPIPAALTSVSGSRACTLSIILARVWWTWVWKQNVKNLKE